MAVPLIEFPCKVRFTVHTYSGTTRTAVYDVESQVNLDQIIDMYMSDTTGETKKVTHTVYHRNK